MRRLLLPLLLVLALAGPATATAGNPLAGHRLGVNSTSDAGNKIYTSWASASGNTKRLYAKMGPRSRVRWYGAWSGTGATLTDKIRRYIALFLCLLPFALLDRLHSDYIVPPICMLVAYPLFSLDQMGIELQNPFSKKNLSHLPLEDISDTIERNVMGLLEERSTGGNP